MEDFKVIVIAFFGFIQNFIFDFEPYFQAMIPLLTVIYLIAKICFINRLPKKE